MGLFSNLFGSSASATGGIFSAIGGGIFGNNASKSNKGDAQFYTDQTKFQPGNLSAGGYNVSWNGNNPTASLSPQLQGIQNNLYGMGGNFLGGLGALSGTGGIDPYLAQSFNAYNSMMPNSSPYGVNPSLSNVNPSMSGVPGNVNVNAQGPNFDLNQLLGLSGQAAGLANSLQGQAANPNQLSTNMGDQYNQTAQGFLGGLGSFNPNQAAADYTNNLRSQAMPENQRAAESLAQNLFNSGRLGSTGGANLFGRLSEAQNQQDLQFQQAGRDYAGQEQNRLAGLAQGFGNLGTGINAQYAGLNSQLASSALNNYLGAAGLGGNLNNAAFNQAVGLNDLSYQRGLGQDIENYNRALNANQIGFDRSFNLNNTLYNRNAQQQQSAFDQGNLRAQQRFQNAMGLFGAGQQNLQNQYNIGTGLLGMGGGIDNNLMNAIGMSGNLEAQRSGVNQAAYNPLLQASVARNNQKAAGFMNGIGAVNNFATTTSSGLGSLFDAYLGGGMGGMGGGGGMMGGFGF